MFWLRLCLILWLSPTVIFPDRVVQGLFHSSPFGEAGEHQSLDSALWNSRDFHNIQQNVQTDEQNHNVHSAHPVNSDFLNQMHEEYIKWAEDEISPVGEWYNQPDSAPNLEEVMNSYHQDQWNSAPVDHSSFSDQNHQKQTYPHVGPSQDQGSSSNTVQPNYDGDFFGGNYGDLLPRFEKFRYPDSTFLPQPHQNFETPHHELSMQNDLSYSPHHSEVGNRGYHNQNWKVSDFNPASSSNNYGFFNTGAAIDQSINSIDNENLIYDTSKNSMIEEVESRIKRNKLFTLEEKSHLLSILKQNFSKCSRTEALARITYTPTESDSRYLEIIHKNAVEFINEHDPQDELVTHRTTYKSSKPDESKIARLKKYMLVEYTLGIEWKGSDVLTNKIRSFADEFMNYGNSVKNDNTPKHIKTISLLGINFMKIIAKMQPKNEVSEHFGNDWNLVEYTKGFWDCCFTNDPKTNKQLREFFKSLGEGFSDKDIDQFLSTGFSRKGNIPQIVFSKIKKDIIGGTDTAINLRFAWYFAFFRTGVYYPQLFTSKGYYNGLRLKTFLEEGIMYFFETAEEVS
ncbi:expressed protein [Phakopsora pachyrhizi]|uniref:Expressed protein n=1 Tax=Phakopsora pachyrhizi TaxID=170000 RepID=A0AAV0BS20_PHAPC|nr:expressed protein [Phakopsora pachyrhizi]